MEMFNVHQVLAARALLHNGRPTFASHGTAMMPSIARVPWHPGQGQMQAPAPSGIFTFTGLFKFEDFSLQDKMRFSIRHNALSGYCKVLTKKTSRRKETNT
jgi:hypothetical protein